MSRFLDFTSNRLTILSGMTLLLTIAMLGCGESATVAAAKETTVEDWLAVEIGGKAIEIQVAFKDRELSRGLMYRTSMGENRGMLFYYDPPKQMSFWMQNTKIPLDIGYFTSDGVLREIYPMYPMDLRSVKSKRNDLLIALEMNQGWYAKNGIKPGASFDLESLKQALLSRGIPESRIPF